jgi:hypothetical protein
MISLDKYILEFIGGNWMTLYLLLTLLKGIALITPNVKDDKIVTLLSQVWSVLRTGKVPDKLGDCNELQR